MRLFPNDRRLGYSGRVHNQFGALGDNPTKVEATRYLGLEIVHLGYDPQLYEARKKAARSLPLIEATVREEPHNHQQRFYLGREYLLLNRIDDSIAALTLALEGVKATGVGPLVDAATHLMRALSMKEQYDQVLVIGQDALTRQPRHPDLWFEFGRGLMHTNQPVAACEAMEKALVCLQEVGSEAQTRLAHHQWEAHEILGQLSLYPALSIPISTISRRSPINPREVVGGLAFSTRYARSPLSSKTATECRVYWLDSSRTPMLRWACFSSNSLRCTVLRGATLLASCFRTQ